MRLSLVLALCSATALSFADAVDDFVKAELTRTKSPSIVIGVIKNGRLIRKQAYGKANLELDVPANADHLYEIGSITKQFTGFATLLLVEEGKLKLDDPVTKYLEDAPKAWEKITLRHMLYQHSGLQDYALVPGLGLIEEFDRAKFMTEMGKLPLDFEPGVAWAYSNTNFALMGWVIEKAAGKPYMQFMRERVFTPLGMTKTTFSNPNEILPGRTAGYYLAGPQLIRSPFSAASINSDGTIISNIEDMAKWDACLRERKILKPASWDLFFSPAKLNSGRTRAYGTGINLTPPKGIPYFGHAGNSAGYSAGYAHYPGANLSVIVMGNVYAFSGEGMARQIAEMVEPSLKPASVKETADPDPKRTDQVKLALQALGENKADSPLLEPEITAPMKTRRAGMSQGLVPLRNIQKLSFVSADPMGRDTFLTYKLITPTRDFVVNALWSPEGKLAQMTMRPDGPPKQQPGK